MIQNQNHGISINTKKKKVKEESCKRRLKSGKTKRSQNKKAPFLPKHYPKHFNLNITTKQSRRPKLTHESTSISSRAINKGFFGTKMKKQLDSQRSSYDLFTKHFKLGRNKTKQTPNIYTKFNNQKTPSINIKKKDKASFYNKEIKKEEVKMNTTYENNSRIESDLHQLRVKTNSLETDLNNELFMLKKHMDMRSKMVNKFLDDIVNVAQNLKQNFNSTYKDNFDSTLQCYKAQIDQIRQIKELIDYKVDNFTELDIDQSNFTSVLDNFNLVNKKCLFPMRREDSMERQKDTVIQLLQDIVLEKPSKRDIKSIKEYNEFLNGLKAKFDTSQTSTLVKQHNIPNTVNSPLQAKKENELNIINVNTILSKNGQELDRLHEFNLDDSKNQFSSRIIETNSHLTNELRDKNSDRNEVLLYDFDRESNKMKRSVSSIALKSSYHIYNKTKSIHSSDPD